MTGETPTTTTTTSNETMTLKILTCTANMGNAEPTVSSMKCWIPENGVCHEVTPLEGIDSTLLSEGSYDIIVIGMQEATWKIKKPNIMKRISSAGDTTTTASETNTTPTNEQQSEELDLSAQDIDDDDIDEMVMDVHNQSLAKIDFDPNNDDIEKEEVSVTDDENNNDENIEVATKQRNSFFNTITKKGISQALDVAKTTGNQALDAAKTTKGIAIATQKKIMKMTTETLLQQPDSQYLRTLIGDTVLGGTQNYHLLQEYQRGQMRLYIYIKTKLVNDITGLDRK